MSGPTKPALVPTDPNVPSYIDLTTGFARAIARWRIWMAQGQPREWEREELAHMEALVARARKAAGLVILFALFAPAAGAAPCDSCPRARQVQIQDGRLRETVSAALLEAYDRLELPDCRLAFGPNHELSQSRLTELTFLDGSREPYCKDSSAQRSAWIVIEGTAMTVCPRFVKKKHEERVAILIHEAFHSTGVTHAPDVDGSRGITARVQEACGQ